MEKTGIIQPYQHAEAFCHMAYESKDPKKYISVIIWNSRDGVTPFCFYSKEFGVELQHGHFKYDLRDPNYQVKQGDLIWRDATDEDKQRWFEATKDRIRLAANNSSASEQARKHAANVLAMYEEDPEQYFRDLNEGEPVLHLVNLELDEKNPSENG